MADSREYIRFEVVDFNCKALSKTVPARHAKHSVCMYSGAIAMGANSQAMFYPAEVMQRGCPNSELLPDWSTDQVLPWASKQNIVVRRVYCEQSVGGGSKGAPKNQALPRTVCMKALEELRQFDGHGWELFAGGELEFTVVKKGNEDKWVPLFDGVDICATLQNAKAMEYCYEVERMMEPVGVDTLTMNAEYGEGQLEFAFVPKFGIQAADQTVTFRTGAKEIAQNRGYLATFMARPFGVDGVGNGGHFNFSLWGPSGLTDEGEGEGEDSISKVVKNKINLFHSSEDPEGLSKTARAFLAGILKHGPALEAVCSSTPPCYTRHGHLAPAVINWGIDDRLAAVRVKADKAGNPSGCYMELRMPSASANPYLVQAAVVAAGMDGLENNLELPPARQTKEDGAAELPSTLEAALQALEADEYMVGKLGTDFVAWYTLVKRGEIKFLDDMIEKGSNTDEALSAAWQHMYMEYV